MKKILIAFLFSFGIGFGQSIQLGVPIGHSGVVTTARYSADGKLILTASEDNSVKLWDAKTYKLIRTYRVCSNGAKSAEFNSDGSKIVVAGDDLARIIDLKTGNLLLTIPASNIQFAKFTKEDQVMIWYFTSEYSSFPPTKIWNSSTGEFISDSRGEYDNRYSADGEYWLDYGDVINIKKGHSYELVSTFEFNKDSIGYIVTTNFSPDNSKVLTSTSLSGAKVWDTHTGKLITTLSSTSTPIGQARFHPSGNSIATISYNTVGFVGFRWTGTLSSVNLIENRILQPIKSNFSPVLGFSFNSKGDQLLMPSINDFAVNLVDAASGRRIAKFDVDGPLARGNYSDDKSSIIVYQNANKITLFSAENQQYQLSIQQKKGSFDNCSISMNNQWLVSVGWNSFTQLWNLNELKKTGKFKPVILKTNNILLTNARFSPDSKTLATLAIGGDIFFWDLSSFKQTSTINTHKEIDQIQFSPDGNLLVSYSKIMGIIDFWNVPNQTLVKSMEIKGELNDIDWERKRILVVDNSKLTLHDLESGKEIISIIQVDSLNWVAATPNGLFDASPEAMDKLYWVQDYNVIDFSQLKERYYEPGLLKKVIQGEIIRTVEGLDKKIELAPEVEISAVDSAGNLKIDLTNQGGGIGKIKVFINGKEIADDIRGEKFDVNASLVTIAEKIKDHPYLIKGDTNIIEVKAYNGENWVLSRGETITYIDTRGKEQMGPHLYLISIGVSNYAGNNIDLKFPSKDAQDIFDAMSIGGNRLFGTQQMHGYLLNSNTAKHPNKENIKKIFEDISLMATSNDVIVIYLSGHGINWGGDDGDWYFLTDDAWSASADAYNDDAIRNKSGISSKELTEWIKKIPALKQVMLIDACASGRIVEDLIAQRDVPSSTIRSLDRMKDRTGLHIITGCAADAVSYEASRYGQGVLTYSLLEGMKGISLREGRFIDVITWFQYARERVPELASGIGGIQEPQIISPNGSESFDVGQIEENDKPLIPLSTIKPMYIRSNFQDEDDLDDVLALGKKVNDALNEYSAKGNESTIVYVDVADFPDAFKLIGRYKRENDTIILTLKVKRGAEIVTSLTVTGKNPDDLVDQLLKKINDF